MSAVLSWVSVTVVPLRAHWGVLGLEKLAVRHPAAMFSPSWEGRVTVMTALEVRVSVVVTINE